MRRADQTAQLDLVALSEDLQADGVEGHRHQSKAEQRREQDHRGPTQAQQGIEASHPCRIRLNVGDLRQRLELEFQSVRERRIASGKRHDKRIRQRILRQARDHLLHPCDAVELNERRVPRHETHGAHAPGAFQACFDGDDLGLCGVPSEEHGEPGVDRGVAGQGLEIAQHAIDPERERRRDPDRQHVERRGKGRARQARERLRETQAVMLQPGPHWSLPWSSVKTRLRYLPISCRSCVATSTVTPTWLKALNISMISSA